MRRRLRTNGSKERPSNFAIMRVKSWKVQSEERTRFTGEPDPFIVKYDVNKVEISQNGVDVVNAVHEQTLRFTFDEQ